MNWLALAFALELGILPNSTMILYRPDPIISQELAGSIYTDLDARLGILDLLYIGGGVRTYAFGTRAGWDWFPTDAFYRVEIGLGWHGVELFFRHYCMHPVIPFFGKSQPTALYEGAYEELGLRFTGKTVLWGKK
jgi:hypothetical protein